MTEGGDGRGVLLYCVTGPEGAHPAAGPDLAGVGGGPVVVQEAHGVALWTEAMERPLEPTPEAILAHQAVVDRAWRSSAACLPVRHGQWFASPDATVAAVEGRLDALLEALERVKDAVEYELRVELDEPDAEGPDDAGGEDHGAARSPGRAYLESLRLRRVRAREADRRRDDALGGLEDAVQDLVRARCPASRGCGVAHLLARSAEARYVERLRSARRAAPDVRVRLKGPWPPWSFGA